MRKFLNGILAGVASLFTANTTSSEAESSRSGPILAMVALADTEFPDASRLTEYMNSTWPGAGPFRPGDGESGMVVVEGPDDGLMTALMIDLPIPSEELQFPCETASGWEEACQELEKAKAHIIVTVMSPSNDYKSQTFKLTALTQAVAANTNSLGIYIGDASTVWSPKQFERGAIDSTPANPPWLLWMGLKAQREEDGTSSVVTMGLPAFGLMNAEIHRTKSDGNTAIGKVSAFSAYLLSEGATVDDGDTFGFSADEKIKITYSTSLLDTSRTVYLLHF